MKKLMKLKKSSNSNQKCSIQMKVQEILKHSEQESYGNLNNPQIQSYLIFLNNKSFLLSEK